MRNEPRPVCPECGEVVDPTKAAPLGVWKPGKIPNWVTNPGVLLGIYCCPEHLQTAVERGWPFRRLPTNNP